MNLEKVNGLKIPLIQDLRNHLATLKKSIFGTANMNLGELAQWFQKHHSIPDEKLPDEPFVVNYQIFLDVDESESLPEDY